MGEGTERLIAQTRVALAWVTLGLIALRTAAALLIIWSLRLAPPP